ncbi:MAG: glycerate kinase [Pseudoflavonifractor sp.]|nr:glycerate kinase [Pseudoflavonifractor sp.]
MRKVVIASDSWKGCLSSMEVGRCCASAVAGVLPGCEVVTVSVADGGEGTCDALEVALGGERVECEVCDPLMRRVRASYVIAGERAVIEMSAASGLTLVERGRRNPMVTTSYGTGQLIADGLRRGCRSFMMGIGGSATNDGGVGMLRALGYRFVDADGREVDGHGGGVLARIAGVGCAGMADGLGEARFTVACDVDNPFCGPRGAAAVFAPQKGADPGMVAALDEGMRSLARVIASETGVDVESMAGAGAAGGLGGAFAAFLGARLGRGVDMVLDAVGFDEIIEGASLVITGEGRLDGQTQMGKTPCGVLDRASRRGIPVVAIGGSVEDAETLCRRGFLAALPVVQGPCGLDEVMRPEVARRNIGVAVDQMIRLVAARL